MTKIFKKNAIWIIIVALCTATLIPINASAASSKTVRVSGAKMVYKTNVTKNSNLPDVTDLTVKASKRSATLKWNKCKNITGYFILRSTSNSNTFKQVAKTKKNYYINKKLKKNKTYNYIICPYKIKNKKYYVSTKFIKVITRTTNSTKKPDTVKGAYLNKTSLVLTSGKTYKLQIIYKGSPFSTWTRWYSSNTNIATINNSGKITTKSAGTATITAKRPSGYNLVCKITVRKVTPKPTETVTTTESLKINKQNISLFIGETDFITAKLGDKIVTHDDPVFWSSSNQNIATIEDGLVTALSEGTVTITIQYENEKKTCKVVVKKIPTEVSSINLTGMYDGKTFENGMTAKAGRTVKLTAKISPETATDKTVTWTSNDTDIATVSNNGTVMPKTEGTAIITASAKNGIKKDFTVKISNTYAKNNTLGIEIGKPFNETIMNNRFGAPVLSFNYNDSTNSNGDTTVYIYDRNGTYNDFVELYVCNGKISGWFTNSDEKVTFEDGATINTDSNISNILNLVQNTKEYNSNVYKCKGTRYIIVSFEEKTDNKGIVGFGVWEERLLPNNGIENREMISKTMLHTMNGIRHEYGLAPYMWLEDLKPALEVAVDSWVEWDSLLNPKTRNPHEDKYGRNPFDRVEQDTNICNEKEVRGISENALSSPVGYLSEISNIGAYWNSSGHKTNLVQTYSNAPYPYCYILTKDNFNGMLFMFSRTI